MNRNITSANTTAVLSVLELYPNGITLEQYSTDQAYNIEQVVTTEDHMGVDGYLTAGYIPHPQVITFTFEPSSSSIKPLGIVYTTQINKKRLYECSLVITQPSLNRTLTFSTGVMRGGTFVANAQKVHSPMQFSFVFEKLTITDTGESTNWTMRTSSGSVISR